MTHSKCFWIIYTTHIHLHAATIGSNMAGATIWSIWHAGNGSVHARQTDIKKTVPVWPLKQRPLLSMPSTDIPEFASIKTLVFKL